MSDGGTTSTVGDRSDADVVPGVPTPENAASGSDRAGAGRNAITCSGCGTWWTAQGIAHCGACHRTFAGVGLFDRHRDQHGDRGKCLDPAAIAKGSPMEFRSGAWRGPEMDDAAKAKAFGKK